MGCTWSESFVLFFCSICWPYLKLGRLGEGKGVEEGNACRVDLSALHWVTDLVPEHWEGWWLLNWQGSTWGAEAVLAEVCPSLLGFLEQSTVVFEI